MAILGGREADPSASAAGTEREAVFCADSVAAGVPALAIVAVFGAGVAAEATVLAGAGVAGVLAAGVATGFASAILSPATAFFVVSVDGTLAAAVALAAPGESLVTLVVLPLAMASFPVRVSGAGVAAEATGFEGAGVDVALAGAVAAAGEASAIFSPIDPFFPVSFPAAVAATLLALVVSFAAVALEAESLVAGCSGAGAAAGPDDATLAAGVAGAFAVCAVADALSPEATLFAASFVVDAFAVAAAAVAVVFEADSLPVRESAAGVGVAAEEATALAGGDVPPILSPEAAFFEDAASFFAVFAVDAVFPAPSLALATGSLEPESLVTMRGSAAGEAAAAFGLVVAADFSPEAALFAAVVSAGPPSSERSSGARALRNCNRFA